MHSNESFYFNKKEPNKSCLLAMRDILLNFDDNVNETTKYGMPCFCYKEKMFCYLWVDKKTNNPYFLIVHGDYINHPRLEKGTRSKMKVFNVNPEEDLPISEINVVLNQAITLFKNGVIKTK